MQLFTFEVCSICPTITVSVAFKVSETLDQLFIVLGNYFYESGTETRDF